jgi:glycosyltransferase involved in cell wall biosynthesis
MKIEFVGKFYDNHSLSIVNRNIVLEMVRKGQDVKIVPLDAYDPDYGINKEDIKVLKQAEMLERAEAPDIQVRHSYPPIWNWPISDETKIVYIQPWEYPKAPFEWQYKFETFADAVIVPSNYVMDVFSKGGLNPAEGFVVPNGYNDALFNLEKGDSVEHLNIDSSKFNFVYVGNSQWRKGLDILLNVWANCFKKYDNAKLIVKDNPRVYGRSNLLQEIINMQYKTGCAEVIYIDDELSDKEMSDIFKASNVLVHPYRAEGFGMHVQEAVACGCIPIISANGPTDDFIPNDAGLKLPTQGKAINITDPSIFAMKPGDAATLMSTHTFIQEPKPEELDKALKYVYHSHEKDVMYDKVKSINTLTNWSTVVDNYIGVFNEVNSRLPKRVR